MSKNYRFPFANYKLGRYKPMTIELDKAGLGRYRHLTTNPIYYENAIKYCGGELYRAVLGYDLLWDRKKERELMLCLDYLLTRYREQKQYHIQELRVIKPAKLHGIKWFNGIPPETFRFDLQWAFELKTGEPLTARINSLDKPYHVDLEHSDGSIYTVSHLTFTSHLNKTFKPLRAEPTKTYDKPKSSNAAPTGNRFQTTKRKSYRLADRLIQENTFRKLSR